eukprot:1082890-Karenia_brevis.AAC.1
MVMDNPPSPMREDGESEDLGPPWPGMLDESFNLVLPGKGNPQGDAHGARHRRPPHFWRV